MKCEFVPAFVVTGTESNTYTVSCDAVSSSASPFYAGEVSAAPADWPACAAASVARKKRATSDSGCELGNS